MSTSKQFERRLTQLAIACALALTAGACAARLPDLQRQGRDYASTPAPLVAVAAVASSAPARPAERDEALVDGRSGEARAGLNVYIQWHFSAWREHTAPPPHRRVAPPSRSDERSCSWLLHGRSRHR